MILVISSVSSTDAGSFFPEQPPIPQKSSSLYPELTNSSGPMQSALSPTGSTSITAKGIFRGGFGGGSFEVSYTLPSRMLSINGRVFKVGNIEILITYSIDGSVNYTMHIELAEIDPHYWQVNMNGSVVLPLLPVGDHSITVYGKWIARMINNPPRDEVEVAQATLNFTVRAPVIKVFSPENISYSSKDLSLNFTTDVPVSWVGYSLDNQDNVTFTGNSSLTGLTFGNHTLAVYANDTAGVMGVSQTVNFIIEAPSEPFSSLIFVVVITVLAAVIAALAIATYERSRMPLGKSKQSNSSSQLTLRQTVPPFS